MAVLIDRDRCVGCGCCSDVCTSGALELHGIVVLHEELCVDCLCCVGMCPSCAITPGKEERTA